MDPQHQPHGEAAPPTRGAGGGPSDEEPPPHGQATPHHVVPDARQPQDTDPQGPADQATVPHHPEAPDGTDSPSGPSGTDSTDSTHGIDRRGEPTGGHPDDTGDLGDFSDLDHPGDLGEPDDFSDLGDPGGPGTLPPPTDEDLPDDQDPALAGLLSLSLPARITVAVALAITVVAVGFHLLMVFFHVAPTNTVTQNHGDVVDDYVLPEFEQNWKLFAPNPLQQNIHVQTRAKIASDDGQTTTTAWIDLSAMDGEDIKGNPAPSHTQQNELRRGWEFFRNSHDKDNKPVGLRGQLSERYIKRIVMQRIGAERDGGSVEQIQVRSATTNVKAPHWSGERTDTTTNHETMPWWTVTSSDIPGGDHR